MRAGARPKRITFGGSYNARPRVSPDGNAARHGHASIGGNYRIAVQDLASGTVRVLSHGQLDESPSFAPNGAMLIYSGSEAIAACLATVAVDGLTGAAAEVRPGRGARAGLGAVHPTLKCFRPS